MEDIEIMEEERDQFELPEIKKPKARQTMSTMSTSSNDSGIGLSLKTSLSSVSSMISDVDTSGCTVAEVPWEVDRADLVIKIKNTLFPVHRSLISLYSDVLKNIIFSVNFVDENTPIVTLMEQDAHDIMELMTYIYFQDKEITDKNAVTLLHIADEFVVSKLIQRCECFLMSKSTRPPIELVKIGSKFRLKSLMEFALVRVSRMPGLLKLIDEADLGLEIENKILRLMIERTMSHNKCSIHTDGLSEECCFVKSKIQLPDYGRSYGFCEDSESSDDDSDDDYEFNSDHFTGSRLSEADD